MCEQISADTNKNIDITQMENRDTFDRIKQNKQNIVLPCYILHNMYLNSIYFLIVVIMNNWQQWKSGLIRDYVN